MPRTGVITFDWSTSSTISLYEITILLPQGYLLWETMLVDLFVEAVTNVAILEQYFQGWLGNQPDLQKISRFSSSQTPIYISYWFGWCSCVSLPIFPLISSSFYLEIKIHVLSGILPNRVTLVYIVCLDGFRSQSRSQLSWCATQVKQLNVPIANVYSHKSRAISLNHLIRPLPCQ